MKTKIRLIALILPGIFLLSFNSNDESEKNKETTKPNILFIAVDDLKPEINTYGASYLHTPNLDDLASQSLIFERSYCNIPVCGASRASILTGLRPTRNRFLNYSTRKDVDAKEVESLPMTLKQIGYTTISNGKVYHNDYDDANAWNEIWHPNIQGDYYVLKQNDIFNTAKYRGPAYEKAEVADTVYADGKIANKGIADLKNLKKSGEPFFLALGFLKPHLPFNAPSKYWDLYDENNLKFPENYMQPASTPNEAFHNFQELRNYDGIPNGRNPIDEALAKKLIHGYYASVSYVDAQIGRVLNALEDLGLAENTIVVLWGDHGWNLGNHKLWSKHSTFESALRTPLIIKIPQITKGQRNDDIVEYIDLYPTICELVGVKKPSHLEGVSLLPLFYEKPFQKNYAVSKFKDAVTLIKGDMFYTEWTDDKGNAYQRMLFDHATDPLELDNLAEKKAYKDLVADLAVELRLKWGEDFLK